MVSYRSLQTKKGKKMNDKIKTIVDTLNSLQAEILKALPFEKERKARIKREFSVFAEELKKNGYFPKFHKTRGKAEWIWYAIPLEDLHAGKFSRNTECGYEYTNVRPDRKTLKGDCTTRTLAYLLSGTKTYDEIEREQYRIGDSLHQRRNARMTWTTILVNHGYRKIFLRRKVKRSVVGCILKDTISRPVATISAHHVAVVDVGGIVRDIWDSRGGRVDEIYAPLAEVWAVADRLENSGVPCSVIE
jgi:hypothetical protein